MVGDARSVDVALLARKLGGTKTNTVSNMYVRFASQKYGLKYRKVAFP